MQGDGDVIEFLQARFQEAFDQTSATAKSRSREANRRRTVAYILKGLAVFGGISIAAGLSGFWSQVVGIVITVAVAVDMLFSNHRRLLIVTAAANAYKNLLSNVSEGYNDKLAEVLKLKRTDQPAAEVKLEKLITESSKKLQRERDRIESGLQEADLKLLNSISLEQDKS